MIARVQICAEPSAAQPSAPPSPPCSPPASEAGDGVASLAELEGAAGAAEIAPPESDEDMRELPIEEVEDDGEPPQGMAQAGAGAPLVLLELPTELLAAVVARVPRAAAATGAAAATSVR